MWCKPQGGFAPKGRRFALSGVSEKLLKKPPWCVSLCCFFNQSKKKKPIRNATESPKVSFFWSFSVFISLPEKHLFPLSHFLPHYGCQCFQWGALLRLVSEASLPKLKNAWKMTGVMIRNHFRWKDVVFSIFFRHLFPEWGVKFGAQFLGNYTPEKLTWHSHMLHGTGIFPYMNGWFSW